VKKANRILTSAVLTAGLGLTGVVTASSSGAAIPKAGHGTSTASRGHAGGTKVFCVRQGGPVAGKPTKAIAEPAAGKAVKGEPSKTAIKVVKGKVYLSGKQVVKGKAYVNGKQVPKENATCFELPPLPAPGKGGSVCLIVKYEGSAKGEPSRTTVKVVKGKVYINGKPAPKSKVNTGCSKLLPLPGPGKPGKPGEPGGVIVGGVPGGGESGVAVGGFPGATNESGVAVAGIPGGITSDTSTGALRG
jgi:hypothetical protein